MNRLVAALLWLGVGVAKTAALILLLTAPETRWPDALAWLGLAYGLVATALWWRGRTIEAQQ